MDLITVLKLGAVNNLSDARFGAGVGAQYLGLNLDQRDPNSLGTVDAPELIQWIQGPAIIGEFGKQEAGHINTVCELLQLGWAQIEDDANLDRIKALETEIILDLAIDNWKQEELLAHMEAANDYVSFYLISLKHGSIEDYLTESGNKEFLKNLIAKYPVFFSFDLNKENLKPLLEEFAPHGINLKGSNEDRPGYKDFEELMDMADLLQKPEEQSS